MMIPPMMFDENSVTATSDCASFDCSDPSLICMDNVTAQVVVAIYGMVQGAVAIYGMVQGAVATWRPRKRLLPRAPGRYRSTRHIQFIV
jgi:hypothetical protein